MEPIRVAWVSGLYSCYWEQRLRLIILVYNTHQTIGIGCRQTGNKELARGSELEKVKNRGIAKEEVPLAL